MYFNILIILNVNVHCLTLFCLSVRRLPTPQSGQMSAVPLYKAGISIAQLVETCVDPRNATIERVCCLKGRVFDVDGAH